MKKISIISILIIIFSSGCTPDRFVLNRAQDYPILGYIMTGLDDVRVVNDNSLFLYPSGRVSLSTTGMTQFIGNFSVELRKGNGVRFYFRTVSSQFDRQPFISLEYTTKGCIVNDNNTSKTLIDSVAASIHKPELIKVVNDGKFIRIFVGCAEIYNKATTLPATEYIIVEAMPQSEVFLYGLFYEELTTNFSKEL